MALPLFLLVRGVSFAAFRTYAGIIYYTGVQDAIRIFYTISAGSLVFILLNIIGNLTVELHVIPYSIVIIDYITSVFLLTGFRALVKMLYLEVQSAAKEKRNVVIYGAGEEGVITKRTLERDGDVHYKVVAFIEENRKLLNKKIEGVSIYHARKDLANLLKKHEIDLLIFSNADISKFSKQLIINDCLQKGIQVLTVPPMSSWVNGELSFKQIKEINIDDLLGRDPIHLDKTEIKKELENKCILITGAAGSIGSEIVRQVMPFRPSQLILLDQAESDLYELEMEIESQFKSSHCNFIVADIRNKDRLKKVFEQFQPQVVFHAAAYKHVPLMEHHPDEAVFTNVLGTVHLAQLSVDFDVEKFVFISTDKAVNPTNVMGASKRVAEIYVQSFNNILTGKAEKHTAFVTTRFGNVLGSNGSVIPLFKKQILSGGPITITHPEVTRYFMTIPEACQLVLEAGAMGSGGEIFLFDMGESVKIADLAKNMVRLSGLELDKDIQLIYTGLRPGEKLYEELLNSSENTQPTHHKKIMIAKVREYEFEEVIRQIDELVQIAETGDNYRTVGKIKAIVPEFISNNSVYEKLDKTEVSSSS